MIQRCCASCQYRIFPSMDEDDNTRVCKKKQAETSPHDCCRMWRMSKGMKAAARISMRTRVKTREYLEYAMPLADREGVDFAEVRKVYSEYCGAVYTNL